MSCTRYKDWLTDAALGALPADRAAEFDAHLASCSGCRQALQAERKLLAVIDSSLAAELAAEPAPDFAARVRQQIAADPATQSWLAGWIPVAAGALAALALLAVWLSQREPADLSVAEAPPARIESAQETPGLFPAKAPHAEKPLAVARASASPPPGGFREPAVLISQNEQVATQMFLTGLRGRHAESWMLAGQAAARPQRELAAPEELKIAPLEVRPLGGLPEIFEMQQNRSGTDWRNGE